MATIGRPFVDITGKRYGRLVCVRRLGRRKEKTYWLFRCDCGNSKETNLGSVRNGCTKSCGCLAKEIFAKQKTHGMTKTSIFRRWLSMLERTRNKNCRAYPRYGGRGIGVSESWLRFENFYQDMGDPPDGKTLDRINNNQGYSIENCRWATPRQQNQNTSANINVTFNGETMIAAEWARRIGISSRSFGYRLKNWPLHLAITAKPRVRSSLRSR